MYPQAKFVSEFGFQSYPTLATYQEATSREDWSMAANMTEYRQRHPNGTVQLVEQFKMHFKVPHGYVCEWHRRPRLGSGVVDAVM